MKKFCLALCLILCITVCVGFKFKKESPLIVLTSEPVVNKETLKTSENIFNPGSRITYMFYYPQGFGDSVIRMQLYKLDDKVQTLGYSLVQTRDVMVDIGDKYYSDYFVIHQSGLYQVQFVEIRKQRRILQTARFLVR